MKQKHFLQHNARQLPKRAHRKMRCRRLSNGRGPVGTVIVEMAVCLPVMLLLVFGCLELNSSIFLSQTLTSAAHEGALVGLRQNATEAEVIERVETIMTARNIDQYTLELKTFGTDFADLESGERFAIAIETPRSNQWISLSQINVEVTALRP